MLPEGQVTHTHTHRKRHTQSHNHLAPLVEGRVEHLADFKVRVDRWRLNPGFKYKQLDKSQSIAPNP